MAILFSSPFETTPTKPIKVLAEDKSFVRESISILSESSTTMGACGSSLSDEEKDQMKKSKAIDAENLQAFQQEQDKIKLLLLGAGESGKSTIFKQMKVLYGSELRDEERRSITPVVYANTITAMKTILDYCLQFGYQDKVNLNFSIFTCRKQVCLLLNLV